MFNLDDDTNENNKDHNLKWPFIPDHLYRILIIGVLDQKKTNVLLNLISQQDNIDKIYLYAKDLSQPKYEFLIKKCKDATKHLNDLKAFIECSNTMDDVYENIDDYNSNRQRKFLIVFDDIIADIMANKKIQTIIKELFIRCKYLFIRYLISKSYSNTYHDGTSAFFNIFSEKYLRLNDIELFGLSLQCCHKLPDIFE